MEFAATTKLRELITIDTPIGTIVDVFKNTIRPFVDKDEYFIYESIVMPDKKYKFFYLSFSANLKEEERTIQIKVELKFESNPQSFVLQNLLIIDNKEEFAEKIKNTEAYKYITSKNIKPIDVSVYEVDI